jgi:uncharacterized protein (TIGR01244 family)
MLRQLDDKTLVSGQIRPEDVPELKRHDVTMIVNNRPDGEEPGQPLGGDIETAAREAGIDYRFIPIFRGIGPADAQAMQEAIGAAGDGKMLAFCRSGTRSALAWAVARSDDGASRAELEGCAARAGVDLTPVSHLL